MTGDEALAFLQLNIVRWFPGADTALLGGSTAGDAAGPGSDLDVVVLYPHLPDGAWRVTERHEGQLVEAFVHDLETLRYFFDVFDGPSGVPILAELVATGLEVPGLPSRLAIPAKAMARGVLAAGPPKLDQADLDRRRFTLSSLAEDLLDQRPRHERIAIVAALYSGLADFALRAAGHFGGNGKGLARSLTSFDPNLASRFDAAFGAGDVDRMQALVDEVLAPYGGRLVDGYRAQAPADWRLSLERQQ
jgi:hypothetical protein